MNSILAYLLSSPRTAIAAVAIAALHLYALPVQAQSKPQSTQQPAPTSAYADLETNGSVTEPKGEDYVAPKKLNPKLARVTLYRPSSGFAPGVAHLEVNGHYHTSLQLGGFTEICVEPALFELAAHMVQTGGDLQNFQDATASLKPEAAQNLYVRVIENRDSRATLTPVRADVAQAELKDTRRQIHAASRVAQAKDCVEPEPKPVATPEQTVKESIVLGSDALFAFGKSDIQGISAQGRDALDELIGRLQKTYGSNDNARIQITGHADPLGSPAANKRLSEARALAIRSYFIQGGMSAKRITGEGMGDTQPVITTCGKTATPESIECNKPNRRVVVSVQVTAR